MAVRIRLKRFGRRNRPFWRICATDQRSAPRSRVIEELGHYDPHKPDENKVVIKRERVVYWLKTGARPSETVAALLAHLGLDARGNEIPPRPWPKKRRGPPPKAAERVAAAKAEAQAAEEAPAVASPAEAEAGTPAGPTGDAAAPGEGPAEAAGETPAEEAAPETPPTQPDAPAEEEPSA